MSTINLILLFQTSHQFKNKIQSFSLNFIKLEDSHIIEVQWGELRMAQDSRTCYISSGYIKIARYGALRDPYQDQRS